MTTTTTTTTTTETATADALTLYGQHPTVTRQIAAAARIAYRPYRTNAGDLFTTADIAAETLTYCAAHEYGRETLRLLAVEDESGPARVRRIATQRAHDLARGWQVSTARKVPTTTADPTADPADLTADVPAWIRAQYGHLSEDQFAAVVAAFRADSDCSHRDRDTARNHVARQNATARGVHGPAVAVGAGDYVDSLRKVHESTTDTAVRLVRSRSAEDMLAVRMRPDHTTADPATAGDYDATLTACVSERMDRAGFGRRFDESLDLCAAGSARPAIARIPAFLRSADPGYFATLAIRGNAAALAAQDSADRAAAKVADLRAALDHVEAKDRTATARKAWREATQASRLASRAATVAADRAAFLRAVAVLADSRPVTLADLVWLSLTAEGIDRAAILTACNVNPDPNGRDSRAMADLLAVVAESALMDCTTHDVRPNLDRLRPWHPVGVC